MSFFGVILKSITWFFALFPKIALWCAPMLRWIPSKFGLLFNILYSKAKWIIIAFFLITVFMPAIATIEEHKNETTDERIFYFIEGMGEAIATPDARIIENIKILKSAQTDDSIKTLRPYAMLIRSIIEIVAIIAVGMIFVGFIFSNASATWGVASIFMVLLIYSLCEIAFIRQIPFSGLFNWWDEYSLIRNLDVLLSPMTPLYELYSSLRERFTTFDLVF